MSWTLAEEQMLKNKLIAVIACFAYSSCAHQIANVECDLKKGVSDEGSLPADENSRELEIEISVPQTRSKRNITLSKPDWHFHVLVTNTTGKPVELWEEWNSWGYYALSFEVVGPSGKRMTVKKKERGWTKNFPSVFVIDHGETVPLDVYWSEEIWEGIPVCEGVSNTGCAINVRAVLKMEPADEVVEELSGKYYDSEILWTGTMYSEWSEYILWP